MRTDQITIQAIELRNQGLSLRRIAEELGVSKSTIDRKLGVFDASQDSNEPLSQEEETEVETDVEEPVKAIKRLSQRQDHTVPLAQIELGKVKLTLAHEEAMEEKRLRKKELEIREKKQTLKERKISLKEEAEAMRLRQREEKIAGRKDYLLRKFHKLVKELRQACEGYQWDIASEVDPYRSQILDLMSSIEACCANLSIEHEDLVIWDTLDLILGTIEDMLEDNNDRVFPKVYLEFDLPEEDEEELSIEDLDDALQLRDFEELVEDVADEEDDLEEDEDLEEEDDE